MSKYFFNVLNRKSSFESFLWEQAVADHSWNEPMMLPSYLRLFVDSDSDSIYCVWYQSIEGGILFPFILRRIGNLEWCPHEYSEYYDLTTTYGYGGPLSYGKISKEDINNFWQLLDNWLKKKNVVSEFIRFWLDKTYSPLLYPGERIFKSKNIVRNLDFNIEAIWKDFEHKVRKNVKRALNNRLTIELDSSGKRIEDFLHIYYSTMKRRNADDYYFFSREFFQKIHSYLRGHFMYFHAIYKDQVISTELVFFSKKCIYSYLGGTDGSAFILRPNDLIKYEIIKWGINLGIRWFVLGGGYHNEDGIYRYKKSFAPSGVVDFYVGNRILNYEVFNILLKARSEYEKTKGQQWKPKTGFFPPYRF